MSGYPAPYIGLPDPEKKQRPVEIMEQPELPPTLAERRGKAWFKKLSLSIKSNRKSNRSSTIPESLQTPVITMEEYLNKPLPPLPSPQQAPYFGYMFADAGVNKKKSDESTDSSETDSNSQDSDQQEPLEARATNSTGSAQSYGLNSSETTQFAFAHAGVNVSTKEIIDNHFASLGTNLEGNLDLATLAEDIEKEKATEDFFGGIKAKEGPSPDHLPVVDEDGFVDRREGLEDWPQLWQDDKETLADYVVPGSENCSIQHNNTPIHNNINGEKQILQPKSQKNKARMLDPSFPDSYQTTTPVITAPAVQPVQSPVRPPRPLTIRKRNNSPNQGHNHRLSQAYRITKRSARDSFVTKSTINGPKPDDFNINLLTTKKIRVTETLPDEDPSSPSRAVSVCGSITSPSSVDLTATSPSNTDTEITDAPALEEDSDTVSLKRKRLTDCLTGYPGQFESYESDYLRVRATMGRVETFIGGEPMHPNGLFRHTNFVADPTLPAKDYTRDMLAVLPVRDLALKHAENMTLSYSCSQQVSALCTPTQEMMRRELHRECAAARLEGVVVGEYRYFQGFMSLEEYIGARTCVCWGPCWCSKLCTIYGDVMCPCSGWLEVEED